MDVVKQDDIFNQLADVLEKNDLTVNETLSILLGFIVQILSQTNHPEKIAAILQQRLQDGVILIKEHRQVKAQQK